MMIKKFIQAVESGDVHAMRHYPELVNVRHELATPLHRAALNGQIEAAGWLLDHGANLEARDGEFHATPLVWANERGHVEMVRFLLQRGASLNEWSAVSTGNLMDLQRLAAAKPEVLIEERDFGTLLHQACIWGETEIVEWLVDQGIDPQRRSQHGFTPLELAERQARDGRSHSPLVTGERRGTIERNCAIIAKRLRERLATMRSQGELAS
jgi:ankyrin repeat protein